MISIYVDRKNLVAKGGLIDDQNEINAVWLQKKLLKKQVAEPKPETEPPTANTTKETPKPQLKSKRGFKNDPAQAELELNNGKGGGFGQLMKQNLEARNKKLEQEIALLIAKTERAYELVVPREHAEFAIISISEGVKRAWIAQTEALLTRLQATGQVTEADVSDIRGEFTRMINEATEAGVTEGKKNLRQASFDMAGKKNKEEIN